MENWQEIKKEQELEEILNRSEKRTQIIFKDSTTCGISASAKHVLQTGTHQLLDKAALNYLDLLTYRSISNLITDQLKVIHQSPQIIVIKDRKSIFSVSHHSITIEGILEALE